MDVKKISQLISITQGNIDSYVLSEQAQFKFPKKYNKYAYGGATVESFIQHIIKAQLRPNDIFMDLGSGVGEKVLITALIYPELQQAIGIEELPELHTAAVQSYKTVLLIPATQISDITFIQKNYFDISIDIADFIYISIDTRELEKQLKGPLLAKLLTLKKGARVMITQVPIRSDMFQLVWQRPYIYKSGNGTIYLFEKIK